MSDEETRGAGGLLDAERQRLRAQGYTDVEISQILVARALGGTGPTAAPQQPQGVFSNVLSSIIAVGGYVGGLFTSVRQDVATILDRSAPARARTGAFAAIAVKAAVIGVLAYAGLQEWQQHINSATEIAAAQAKKLQIEADNAKAITEAQVKKIEAEAAVAKQVNDAQAQKLRADADAAKALNDAQVKKLEAEAAVAKKLNDAQAEKLRADADAAKALNEAQVKKLESEAAVAKELNEAQTAKARAEECSARMKAAIDTMPMDKLLNGGTAEIQRDCDPAYMARAKACDEKFGLVLSAIETIDLDDQDANGTLKKAASKYKEDCRITPEQEKLAKAALDRRNERIGKIPLSELVKHLRPTPSPSPSSTSLQRTASLPPAEHGDVSQEEIASASARGDYGQAYDLAHKRAVAIEEDEQNHHATPTFLPWVQSARLALLSGYYTAAHDESFHAWTINPGNIEADSLLGCALMMMGRAAEAQQIFQKLLGKPASAEVLRKDFDAMRKAGVTDKLMAETESQMR